MATPKTPVRVRLDELLSDGAWHNREHLVADTVGVVPPGVAARRATTSRRRSRTQRERDAGRDLHEWNGGGTPRGDDIRVGARDLVVHRIGSAVGDGAFERRTLPDGTVQIRRPPRSKEPT